MKRVIAIVVLFAVVMLGVSACAPSALSGKDTQADIRQYWPQDEWRTSTPEEQGMDSDVLAQMIDAINEDGKNINSVTIIRNGYLVSEIYFYPYQKGIKHAANSCAKSFLSAVTGNAIQSGSISLDDPMLDYFAGVDVANIDSRKQDMTIRNLLDMTSGLDWKLGENDSTNAMLQSGDWAQYTLDLPMREEPGTAFNYCNGAANITSSIVQNTTGKTAEELFNEQFGALGITDYCWGISPENTTIGYSGIFMTPDDLAKFGYLYLRKGNWNGEQLVPEEWVEESTKLQTKADWNPLFPGYGYMWWITRFDGMDGYAAMGYGGDYIFVVPDKDLVVVFTAGMFNTTDLFYPGELMDEYIVPAAKADRPINGSGDALQKAVQAAQSAPENGIEPLPEIALRTSGKTYSLGDLGTLVFYFTEGSNEFTFDLLSGTFTAGLDGAFRVSDIGINGTLPDHNLAAARGTWLSEDTLELEIHSLVDGYITIYTVHFSGDSLEATARSNIFSDTSFTGKIE